MKKKRLICKCRCGEEAFFMTRTDIQRYGCTMVLCPACGRRTAECENQNDAAKEWNRISRLTLCEQIVKLVKKTMRYTVTMGV